MTDAQPPGESADAPGDSADAGPGRPPPTGGAPHDLATAVSSIRGHLESLERMIGGESPAVGGESRPARGAPPGHPAPGWTRPAPGEERWPVATAVVVAVALQVALPARLTFGPRWLLPVMEGALLIGVTAANPRHVDRRNAALRAASIVLIALISVANGWSVYELIGGLINGTAGKSAGPLLSQGASIYLTNIVVFALWYWEWDRGGPVARAFAVRTYPDLLFPQMAQAHLAPDDWRPIFFDYFYVSYTNATAFSPTDTMPLAPWTKLLFFVQSGISLVTVALVVARAVNIFG